MDAEAAVQQVMDDNAKIAPAPIAPTTQPPSSLSNVADTASQLNFQSVLDRLGGLMKVADLAAEACWFRLPVSNVRLSNIYLSLGPPFSQISVGGCISSV